MKMMGESARLGRKRSKAYKAVAGQPGETGSGSGSGSFPWTSPIACPGLRKDGSVKMEVALKASPGVAGRKALLCCVEGRGRGISRYIIG